MNEQEKKIIEQYLLDQEKEKRKDGLTEEIVKRLERLRPIKGYNFLEVEIKSSRREEIEDTRTGDVTVFCVLKVKEAESQSEYEIYCKDWYGDGFSALFPLAKSTDRAGKNGAKGGVQKGVMSLEEAQELLSQNKKSNKDG